jgi:cysteine desulfurase/selenocysteine lyase
MSTSEWVPPGLPDAAELQRWANAIFQAPPGAAPPLVPGAAAAAPPQEPPFTEQGLAGTSVHDLNDPRSSLRDPHGIALDAPGASLPRAETFGHAPASVAGSGVSPAPLQASSSPAGRDATGLAASWPAHGQSGQSYGASAAQAPAARSRSMASWDDSVSAAQGLPYADDSLSTRQLLQSVAGDGQERWPSPLSLRSANEPVFYFLDAVRSGQAAGLLSPGPKVPGAGGLVAGAAQQSAGQLDVHALRRDFPALRTLVKGRPLVWLDNAATTHKPQCVMDRLHVFYSQENSNIHRAAHEMAARATDAYEGARETVRAFLNARSAAEIVFTRGTTESINLVAQSWGRQHIEQGDEIIVSQLEHHANIVPWFQLAQEKGAHLKVIPVNQAGELLLDEYARMMTPRTKLVAFTQVSNALGTVTPAARVIEIAHAAGVTVLLDGAQSISHMRIDLQDLAPDFFVFSGHKVFGPTGIGVLYGREALLNSLPPWQGGGNMIQDVTFERILYQPSPNRFEAGTGNIADAVGLGAALDYVSRIGIDAIERYEQDLLRYATCLLQEVPGLRLVGTAAHKASVLSFVLAGYASEEVGRALNELGIAVRSGHHCAQPILRRMGLESTVRPSLAFYNTRAEIDLLASTLQRLQSARFRAY